MDVIIFLSGDTQQFDVDKIPFFLLTHGKSSKRCPVLGVEPSNLISHYLHYTNPLKPPRWPF